MKKFYLFVFMINLTIFGGAEINVSYTISPQYDRLTISPYIYGTNYWGNYNKAITKDENFSFYRLGGNRLTGYNWVNNATNAGSDYRQQNDGWMTDIFEISSTDANTPGRLLTAFVDRSASKNASCLLTLPIAGYVAKDKNGPVGTTETAPSARWCVVAPNKGAPFTLTPTLDSNTVYIDECVNFLVNKYGLAAQKGVKAYSLDNEPALWHNSHPRIHPDKTECNELIQKTVAYSSSIKSVDSTAEIYAPVLMGMGSYLDLGQPPDWVSSTTGKDYRWFIDLFLDKMNQYSKASHQRLLDVLDLHDYPEGQGDHRFCYTNPNNDSVKDKLERLQSPRTFWDKNYFENSWVGKWRTQYLPLIPTIQSSINQYYPGTKLAFTEYDFGASWDITGGVTQADVLGVFGKYGVYAACLWPRVESNTYALLAFQMYQNYDGKHSKYGDINVQALMSDTVNSSVYASVMRNNLSELHIMVLNKNMTQSIKGKFKINSKTKYQNGITYSITSSSTSITGPVPFGIKDNSFIYNLPPLTVTHMILNTPKPSHH